MSSREIEPSGIGAVWPLAPRPASALVPAPGYQGYGATPTPVFELTLASLWQIVWEWRWLILSAAAAGAALAIVSTLLTTPVYRSTATLEISPPAIDVSASENAARGERVVIDETFLQTQLALLKSRSLAERVAEDLNLASNEAVVANGDLDRAARREIAAGALAGGLAVERVGTSRLIRLSFDATDPALTARAVNGFADAFVNTSLERRYQSSSYAREFLQRQINNTRRELERTERALVTYAQREAIINTGGGAAAGGGDSDVNSLSGSTLVQLNESLAQAQTRRILAEQQYRESLGRSATVEVGERTATLRSDRAKLQAEYDEKSTVFRPDYPDMVRLKSRITSIDQAIAAEASNVRSGRSGTLAAEFQAAQRAEAQLRSRVAQLRGEVLDQRGRAIQYNILRRDVDTNRALYDALLQRYKEIGVTGGVGVSFASVADRGQVPGGPYKPNLMLNIWMGLFAGLITGLGIALVLEFVNDTIKTPDDVRDRLRLAFLGGIPALKGRRPVEALREQNSPITEAFFSTGTALSFTTEDGAPTTLLVTSTRPAEGKSTTVWALAQYFARLDRRVLLIDADLRKPAFVTGHERDDGLSNLLTTRDAVESHIVQTDNEGLWLLPCGPIPPNPAELLASPRMQAIVDEASRNFDMVVIDGPPILGLADAPLLSTTVRGTLMVVESGRTRTRAAVEALNRMRGAGANMVGCVLMRYRHETSGYGYKYEAYAYKSIDKRAREIRAITGQTT